MKPRPIGDVDILVQRQLEAAARARCSRLPTFHALPRDARRRLVAAWARLSHDGLRQLDGDESGRVRRADRAPAMRAREANATTFDGLELIANVRINGRDLLVPMAVDGISEARQASRGALLARRGDGFLAHADPERRRCEVRCRIDLASLARGTSSGRETAGHVIALATRLQADPARAAEARQLARATAGAVAAAAWPTAGWSTSDIRPMKAAGGDWLPRAWHAPDGPLVLQMHASWPTPADLPIHSAAAARLGARILDMYSEHDLALVAASAGLARLVAWAIAEGPHEEAARAP